MFFLTIGAVHDTNRSTFAYFYFLFALIVLIPHLINSDKTEGGLFIGQHQVYLTIDGAFTDRLLNGACIDSGV